MKRRILSVMLCICMFLPLLGLFTFAQGTEVKIERYFSGAQSDWEIYAGNTNLVVRVVTEDYNKIGKMIDNGLLSWQLETNGTVYEIDPISYFLGGNANEGIILRFPTFQYGFCPAFNPYEQFGEDAGVYYDIDIRALDAEGNVVYYGSAKDLHSSITDPEIPGVPALNGSRIGDGMQNTQSATELLFTIKEDIASKLYDDRAEYTWRFSVASGRKIVFFEAQPTSFSASDRLFTFEPCLAAEQFIPQRNVTYYINLELWKGDTLAYFAGGSAYGYTLSSNPIVPTEKYTVTFRMGTRVETAQVYEGQMPKMPTDTSFDSGSPAFEYIFKGWDPQPQKVTEDTIYTATYEKVPARYDITFVTENGTQTKTWTYGEMPSYEGELSAVKTENGKAKVFVGWDRTIETVKASATYRAQYRVVDAGTVPVLEIERGNIYKDTSGKFLYTLKNAKEITSVSFTVQYDKERFELEKIKTLVSGMTVDADCTVTFTGTLKDKNVALVEVWLKPKQDAAFGKSELNAENILCKRGNTDSGYFLNVGSVTLCGVLSGDINKDCRVETTDGEILLQGLIQKSKLSADMADTNHDGTIDLRDAVRICSYVAGATDEIWSSYDDTLYTVVYRAETGGEIVGTAVQTLTRKQTASTVFATTYMKNYAFAGWSDGKSSSRRQDFGIEENVVLTAHFEETDIVLDFPEVHISTLGGASITSKDDYLNAVMSISGSSTDAYNVTGLPMEIKGRGNYTWEALRNVKPSYRLRLADKASLLGMAPEERDWILLTVYNDVSMLRNYTTWRLGELFDNIPYSVKGEYVILYVNEEYYGVYLLCERVEASRLELDDSGTSLDKDYLLELDSRASGEGQENLDWFTVSGGQKPFVIKSEVSSAQETKFIQNWVSKLNTALLSGELSQIEHLVDLDSLVDMYIVEEFGKDRDVGFASFYLYKKAGGKFYFTCPWDFDLGWGNDEVYAGTDNLLSTAYSGNSWFGVLSTKDWFKTLVQARMKELTPRVNALAGEILAMAEALTEQAIRDEQYFNTIGRKLLEEPASVYNLQSYKAHCEYFYNWYVARWQWLCEYFDVK